jgi:hypothetical protein
MLKANHGLSGKSFGQRKISHEARIDLHACVSRSCHGAFSGFALGSGRP